MAMTAAMPDTAIVTAAQGVETAVTAAMTATAAMAPWSVSWV
jgi:hypothetical protein